MKREEAQELLDKIPPLVEPTASDRLTFFQLVNHPGFKVLMGMLISTRQGYYVQLSKLPLEGNEHRVSVIQGTISGIEKVGELVIELALENAAPTGERI